MRASDYLFQLIKAMTKGDRRNFKLFAQLQEGDKKYIQLFDAICKQDEYDERLLLQQFEGERFTNQFSVAKNYLYRYILKTLHVFQKDSQDELMTLVNQVRILISKNLFDQAHKLLRKAMHQAESMESFTYMLNLLQMEREIYFFSQKLNEFSVFILDIQKKEKETQRKIRNLTEYNHIQDQSKIILKKIREAKTEKEKDPFSSIWENPFITDESKAISVRAQIKRLSILSDCAANEGKFADCITYSTQIIQIFEENPTIKEVENLIYLLELSNLSIHYYLNQKFDKAFETLRNLRNATFMTQQEEIRLFEKTSQITLVMATEQGNIEEGIQIANNIEESLKTLDGKIRKSAEMSLYYHMSSFWMVANDPSEGLKWSNKFLNEPKTELQMDYQSMARVVNIILHFELGHFDLLEYSIKSAYRFIYKHERLFKFESLILRTIKRLTESSVDNNRTEILKAAKKELQEVLKDPYELRSSYLFDFDSWLNSKLNGTSLAREKQKTSLLGDTQKAKA